MKSKLNFRSVVFQRAYRIAKQTGCDFANALKAAWNLCREYKNRMIAEVAERVNQFDFYFHFSDDRRVYRKWNNESESLCNILATLPASYIPAIVAMLNNCSYIQKFI